MGRQRDLDLLNLKMNSTWWTVHTQTINNSFCSTGKRWISRDPSRWRDENNQMFTQTCHKACESEGNRFQKRFSFLLAKENRAWRSLPRPCLPSNRTTMESSKSRSFLSSTFLFWSHSFRSKFNAIYSCTTLCYLSISWSKFRISRLLPLFKVLEFMKYYLLIS